MRKESIRRFIMLLLIMTLIASFSYPVFAADQGQPKNQGKSLSQPISLLGKSKIELTNIYSVPGQEGQLLAFTLELDNQESTEIDFFDYWVRLSTKSGSRYTLNIVEQGDKSRVLPGQKQIFTFYTTLPSALKLENIQLRLIKWDFYSPSFERDIGQLPINFDVIPTLGRSMTKFLGLTNNTIEATIKKGSTVIGDEESTVSYQLTLQNKGFLTFVLPDYRYVLVTNEGLVYPLNAGENGSTNVLPRMSKKIALSGVVPNEIDLSKVKIYILQTVADGKGDTLVPVSLFQEFGEVSTPIENNQMVELGETTEIILENQQSSKITLTKVQRLPWDHRDLISAEVELENTTEKQIAIPQLEGSLTFDKMNKVSAEVVSSSSKTSLNPGEKVSYYVSSYISYTKLFTEAVLELKEKGSEGTQSVILSKIPLFHFYSDPMNIELIEEGKSYPTGVEGERKTIQLIDTRSYRSANGTIVAARLEIKNQERRSASVPKLIGAFRANDATVYTANIDEAATMNFPNGSSVITLWTEVPKDLKQESMQLIVGEALGEDSMKNTVRFNLPRDNEKSLNRINTIELYPYTLYFKSWGSGEIEFDKKKVMGVIANASNRKLIVTIVGRDGYSERSETVTFDGSGAWESGRTINVDDGEVVFIYEEYQGGKKLIASQSF